MRDLNTSFLAAIAKTITDPIYLIRVPFEGGTTIFATTREAMVHDGENYSYEGADMLSINSDRVQFSLPNETRVVSPLAFGGQIQGNQVKLFLAYDGEVLARFVGVLDAPRIARDYNSVLFTATSIYAAGVRWPHERIRPPTFNHLPPPGRTIKIGTAQITLEKDAS